MASILKLPTFSEKGILVFTSQERSKFISNNINLQKRIKLLKKKWVIGTHHNWHIKNFLHDGLYDFDIAGEKYLNEVNKRIFPRLDISAANFVPDIFELQKSNKYWDILYVGRVVDFKKIPDFFNAIRKLYDSDKFYRVLFIAPAPPNPDKKKYKLSDYSYEIMDLYKEMFSFEERKFFNFITIDYDYPFPFDLETLANFYKTSRVFVYTSDDEMRPRTVGYAIASGLPIIVRKSVSYLLPKNIRKAPHIYTVEKKEDFPEMIDKAIAYSNSSALNELSMKPSIDEFNYKFSLKKMRTFFLSHFNLDIFVNSKKNSLLEGLDIRIARHHGLGNHGGSLGWSLESLLNYLEQHTIENMRLDAEKKDIERYILKYIQYGKIKNEIIFKESYLNNFKASIKKLIKKTLNIT